MQKVLTHQAANTKAFREGAPGAYAVSNSEVREDYQLTPTEVERGYVLIPEEQFRAEQAALEPSWQAWVALHRPEDQGISKQDFLTRMSNADRAALKTAMDTAEASGDFSLRLTWETFLAIPELVGPPDDTTAERRFCLRLRNSLRKAIGANRANRLFE